MNPTLADISGWDENYVIGLPNGEYDWIDFKSSQWCDLRQGCLDHLSKYVSAFANFDGGYLVIGVSDPQPGQPLHIDGGISLGLKPDLKGWFEDILPRLVDPPISKLNVHLIANTEHSLVQPGNALVVIHILPSQSAPHQASDHKYYTRIGSKLNPLGHQAILDIFGRKRNPVIKTEIFIHFSAGGQQPHVQWRVTNLSDVFVRYVLSRINIPSVVDQVRISFDDCPQIFSEDRKSSVWQLVGFNPIVQPLFPRGTVTRKFPFNVVEPDMGDPDPPHISYITYADHMPPVEGTIGIDEAIGRK